MSNVTHRRAEYTDLPQIVEIYNSTIPSRSATADLQPVAVESRKAWFRDHDPATRPIWVVDIGGAVQAWLSFSNFYGRPAYQRTAEISVYVRNCDRRRGLGAYLLGQAVAVAPSLGVDTLLGFIFAHNAACIHLFERSGFTRWGDLPRVALLDGVERSLLIVGKRMTK